jgi:hypothetical protein
MPQIFDPSAGLASLRGGPGQSIPDRAAVGLESLSQPRDVSGPEPRRFNSFIGPQVQQQLELLQQAIQRGLPPEIAQQEYERITGNVHDRFDAYKNRLAQTEQQQGLDALMSSLPPGVGQAAQLSQMGVPAGVVQSVFESQQGGGAPMGLDPESANAVAEHVTELIAGGVPLHNARMIILGRMRAQGSNEDEIRDAYDLIGQQYSAAPTGQALMAGRPLTYAQRAQELQSQQHGATAPGLSSIASPPQLQAGVSYPGRTLVNSSYPR